jgi:2-dehydropantoate 2-reductase
MNYCVVGAGPIGGFVGAKLALAGEDVTLVARGANLQAIRAHGMRVIMHDGTEQTATGVRAAATPVEAGVHDVVILGVKAHRRRTDADHRSRLRAGETARAHHAQGKSLRPRAPLHRLAARIVNPTKA